MTKFTEETIKNWQTYNPNKLSALATYSNQFFNQHYYGDNPKQNLSKYANGLAEEVFNYKPLLIRAMVTWVISPSRFSKICIRRSWVIGRGISTPSKYRAIACASELPTMMGKLRLPSASCNKTAYPLEGG